MTHDLAEAGDRLAYQDMVKARQEFIQAWRAWLDTGPSVFASNQERHGTESAVDQLFRLHLEG